MKILGVCSRNVVVAERGLSLVNAAKLMRENHVGSIVVVEGDGAGRVPVGIVTDRDIVMEVVASDMDPRGLTCGDIMGPRLVTAHQDDDAHESLATMRRRGIRRMPVVDSQGALAGIVTLDDLIGLVGRELMDVVQAIGSEQQLEAWRRRQPASGEADLPVAFLTASARREDRDRALQADADVRGTASGSREDRERCEP